EQAGQLVGAESLAERERPDAVAVEPEGHAPLTVAVQVDGLVLELELEGVDGERDLAFQLQRGDETVEQGGEKTVDGFVADVIKEEGPGGGGEAGQERA